MVQTHRKIMDSQVSTTLNRMHNEADSEGLTIAKGLAKGIFRKIKPEDLKDAYIAISRGQGHFLYNLLIEKDARHIVEFGTSFGISTMYLGAAAKVTGGKVITSELLAKKCKVAQQNFDKANLQDWIEIREGDALETLRDIPDGIDFLLLDGWNDLYLPLLKILEPKFKKGTLIYTDNASFSSAKPLLNYIKANPAKYTTKRLRDAKGGSELTEYIAD